MKKETFIVVSYRDIEKLICETYGIPPSKLCLPSLEEANKDSYRVFSVEKKELAKVDKEILDNFVKTHLHTYGIGYIFLQDMCFKGIIEPGPYLVQFSW